MFIKIKKSGFVHKNKSFILIIDMNDNQDVNCLGVVAYTLLHQKTSIVNVLSLYMEFV